MMRYFYVVRSLWVALSVASISMSVHASLQQEMNSLFGRMTTVTHPGVYNSQRRGMITGGSVVSRSPIVQENLVSFVPPSFEAGCGGIDMYAGSLSFVNADQFVQVLRAVAANARGYAFQLALSAMCEKCSQQMETLQKKIQQLNQYFGNSCQLAQGVVNDTLSAYGKKGETDASMLSTLHGAGDVFTSWSQHNGQSPYQQAATVASSTVRDELSGNLMWRALRTHDVAAWFAQGDTALLEAIMSITGTVIMGEIDTTTSDSPTLTVLHGNQLRLGDVIAGGDVMIYRCDTAEACLSPTLTSTTLVGLTQQVEALLLGDGSQVGLVSKFAGNTGSVTTAERAFLSATPSGFGGMVRNLAAIDEHAAAAFVRRVSPYIALDMASLLIDSLLKSAATSSALHAHPYHQLLITQLQQVSHDVRDDYRQLQQDVGNAQTLLNHYQHVLQAAQRQHYAMPLSIEAPTSSQ